MHELNYQAVTIDPPYLLSVGVIELLTREQKWIVYVERSVLCLLFDTP